MGGIPYTIQLQSNEDFIDDEELNLDVDVIEKIELVYQDLNDIYDTPISRMEIIGSILTHEIDNLDHLYDRYNDSEYQDDVIVNPGEEVNLDTREKSINDKEMYDNNPSETGS